MPAALDFAGQNAMFCGRTSARLGQLTHGSVHAGRPGECSAFMAGGVMPWWAFAGALVRTGR
jgi:hypothetical protein